jgi:hypothetical protein
MHSAFSSCFFVSNSVPVPSPYQLIHCHCSERQSCKGEGDEKNWIEQILQRFASFFCIDWLLIDCETEKVSLRPMFWSIPQMWLCRFVNSFSLSLPCCLSLAARPLCFVHEFPSSFPRHSFLCFSTKLCSASLSHYGLRFPSLGNVSLAAVYFRHLTDPHFF